MAAMERCIETARKVGVHREFCVFSDRQVVGAVCYEAGGVEAPEDRRFWVYLSAGVKKFAFDYAVWLSPGTVFRRVPGLVLRVLEGAPVHVPLVRKLKPEHGTDREKQLCAVYRDGGVRGEAWLADNGFWIVKLKAVEHICKLAAHGIALGKGLGLELTGAESLGYAGQMLCGDPEKHKRERHADLWGRKGEGLWREAAILLEAKLETKAS